VDDSTTRLLVERVQADHYVSSYCTHALMYSDDGEHRRCRLRCKDHNHPCRCPCHTDGRGTPIPELAESQPMCTTGDHEDVPAVGEARVEDDPTWYPYCAECLLLCDPPRRWYGKAPDWELADLEDEQGQRLVKAVDEALLMNGQRLRELHHTRAHLDANARNLVAQIAVTAILRAQEKTT
jgi:hypothetical protein